MCVCVCRRKSINVRCVCDTVSRSLLNFARADARKVLSGRAQFSTVPSPRKKNRRHFACGVFLPLACKMVKAQVKRRHTHTQCSQIDNLCAHTHILCTITSRGNDIRSAKANTASELPKIYPSIPMPKWRGVAWSIETEHSAHVIAPKSKRITLT